MAGFLVPFLSGGLIKSQQIRDEYDENAGNIVDAASAKYNEQFDLNKKAIELQNSNYAAVSGVLGPAMAEVAAKDGNLNDVPTNQVVSYVKEKYSKAKIDAIQKKSKEEGFNLSDLGYQTLFSEDYATATKSLKKNRDWAAKHLNKGAIKNVTDLYLDKDTETSALGKAQKFMFGDKITKGTGVAFDQAAAQEIGDEITLQPKSISGTTLEERLAFTEPVNIGTVAEQDKAIAAILNVKDIRIAEGGGILFPVRFRNEALAIKEKAQEFALEFTTMKGGTEVVNVSGLMQKAHNELAATIIAPIANRFIEYKPDTTSSFAKSMSFRVMEAKNINLDSRFYSDNNLTKEDFVLTDTANINASGSISETAQAIVVSKNAADAMQGEIDNLNSMATQKLYVDYLPDNLMITRKDGQTVPLKTYYKDIFALASY